MKKLVAGMGLGLFAWNAGHAALPPYNESVRRLEATLADKSVVEILNGTGEIRETTRLNQGYWIKTDQCQIFVEVTCAPPDASAPVGPCPLEIKVQSPGCVQ